MAEKVNSEYVRLNLVLLLPPEVDGAVIELNRNLAQKYKLLFALDGAGRHPHITLYAPEYPAHNLERIIGAAEEISKRNPPQELEVKGVRSRNIGGQRYILAEVDGPRLAALYRDALAALDPLREGHVREHYADPELLSYLRPEEKEAIRRFGYFNAGAAYEPHLTLGVLVDPNAEPEVEWNIRRFRADVLALSRSAAGGAAAEIIASFPLGGK